jgi:hypothetical protein
MQNLFFDSFLDLSLKVKSMKLDKAFFNFSKPANSKDKFKVLSFEFEFKALVNP